MIQEAYCSYEVSRLLKEKGFPMREHSMMYTNKNNVCLTESAMRQHLSREDYLHFEDFFIPTITHQMAMRWLREVHNIFININVIPYTTVTMEQRYYFYKIYKNRRLINFPPQKEDLQFYDTPEETIEAGIKFSLENLI